MDATAKKSKKAHPIRDKEIPPVLIYEEENGQPIFYRGYEAVLAGNKNMEEIMGCSSLQAEVIRVLLKYLYANVDGNGYQVYTNEPGMHLSKGNNRASDIAIYSEKVIAGYPFDEQYFQIPPAVGIEVDIKAEMKDSRWEVYLKNKTTLMLEWGVEKVIWIFTPTRQIIIAEPEKDWLIREWEKDFEILSGHTVNLSKLVGAASTKTK